MVVPFFKVYDKINLFEEASKIVDFLLSLLLVNFTHSECMSIENWPYVAPSSFTVPTCNKDHSTPHVMLTQMMKDHMTIKWQICLTKMLIVLMNNKTANLSLHIL